MRCTFIPLSHLHSADNLFRHNSQSSLGTRTDRGTTRARARRGSPLPSFSPSSAPDATRSCPLFYKSLRLTHSPTGYSCPSDERNIHRPCPGHASHRASLAPVACLMPLEPVVLRTFYLPGKYFAHGFVF